MFEGSSTIKNDSRYWSFSTMVTFWFKILTSP